MLHPESTIAWLGLVLAPLLVGCVGEENDRAIAFPAAVGTDDPVPASQGGLPDPPATDWATDPMADEAMPAYPDENDPVEGDSFADDDPSALADFRGALDPHGQWLDDPEYGTMWQPSASEVGTDFAPYLSGGHWGYDDSNYVWVSDYSWGWAPFHYGRWTYGSYGWGWIPGRTYSSAWVTWRTGPAGYGYVGWAPLPPTWRWGAGGVSAPLARIPAAPYAFCESRSLFASGLASRVVTAPAAVQSIAAQTRPFTSGTAAGGRVTRSAIAGPSPASLHIAAAAVNHVTAANPQLSRARQFARPSSAMALGAHGVGVGGQLGPVAPSSPARSLGAATNAHASLSTSARSASMPSYGGSSHAYYNNRASTQLGSSYGHGGSMRSYDAPAPAHGTPTYHPVYEPSDPSNPSHTTTSASSSHFGGHYGGGGSTGGRSGGGRR